MSLLLALALAARAEEPAAAPAPPADAPSTEPAPAPSAPAAPAPTPPPGDSRDDVFGAPAGDSRDDIFGTPSGAPAGDAPSGEAPAAPTGNRDDDILSGADGSRQSAMFDTLDDLEKRVTLGGRMYLRLNATVPEEGEIEDIALSNPNFLDLYVDARPSDRIRGYVQARLSTDLTVADGDLDSFGNAREPTSILLDQLWMNFDIGKRVYVTAGRQRVKWGIGRFWNPTDFLQPARLDPLAFFDERTGVGLVKVHVPFEKTGTNVYVFADIEDANSIDQVGGAMRVEQVVGLTEVAVSASVGKDRPIRLGAQFSTGISFFDLKAEASITRGLTTAFYRGTFDWGPLDDNGFASFLTLETPDEYSREDEWVPQVVAGIEIPVGYNDEDSLYIGAEYFYNDAGYDDASLYPWLLFNNAYTPFYTGKHYAAAYVALPGPGEWDDHTFTVSTIGNLSDKSFTSRLDYSVRALTFLSLTAYASANYGEYGELRFELDVPPILGVTEEGTKVPATRSTVGVGAQITF